MITVTKTEDAVIPLGIVDQLVMRLNVSEDQRGELKKHIERSLSEVWQTMSRNDSIQFSIRESAIAFGVMRSVQNAQTETDQGGFIAPPSLGRLLICMFVPIDKQEDRLADFDERLRVLWIPEFGPRIGRLVYVWHALRSAGAILKIGLSAAIVDRIARKFGW